MNFCSHCSAPVTLELPHGDDRPRFVCTACHTIHYENPKMVVGCIASWQNRILLCRRSIEPRAGMWTVPAGYLENGETMEEGAKREAFEEARAELEIMAPYTLLDLTHVNQVYLIYHARLIHDRVRPGEESTEVGLFREADVPWDQMAFSSIHRSLRLYFKDRPAGKFPLHTESIPPP